MTRCQHFIKQNKTSNSPCIEFLQIDKGIIFRVSFIYRIVFGVTDRKVLAMSTRFELICESIHCFGKHIAILGTVATEKEARDWKKDQTESGARLPLQENDPIRNCPVVRCPLKKQPPRFDYREVSD